MYFYWFSLHMACGGNSSMLGVSKLIIQGRIVASGLDLRQEVKELSHH